MEFHLLGLVRNEAVQYCAFRSVNNLEIALYTDTFRI